jgi:hypothetical protein
MQVLRRAAVGCDGAAAAASMQQAQQAFAVTCKACFARYRHIQHQTTTQLGVLSYDALAVYLLYVAACMPRSCLIEIHTDFEQLLIWCIIEISQK